MYFQQRIDLPAAVALLSKGNCVARALYDNVADTPDELAFRKGDLLTVLEQNPNGLEGWWLCSFRGRQGICPANRVRLIPRVYDAGTLSTTGLNTPSMPGTPTGNNGHSFLNTSVHASLSHSGGSGGGSSGGSTCSSKSNSSTGSGPSAALLGHVAPKAAFQEVRGPVRLNKIVKPVRSGDAFTYDVPRAGFSFDRDETDAAGQGNYDLPPVPRPVTLPQAMECYDVPRATTGFGMTPHPGLQDYDVPRNHSTLRPKKAVRGAAVVAASDDADFDRPKEEEDGTYDIPRAMDQLSISGPSEDYDVPARLKRLSDRSSGVSLLSSSSSGLSAASSVSSESLSLSSVGASGSQSGRSSSISLEVYDVPPSAVGVGDHNNSRRVCRNYPVQDVYDVPPPRSAFSTPPPPSGSLEDYDVPKASKTTPQALLYDVPPQALRLGSSSRTSSPRLSTLSDSSSRDSRDLADLPPRELPLELDSAVETLSRLHQEVSSSINRLLSFTATASTTATSTGSVLKSSASYWRKRENLEPKLMELRLAGVRLQTALREFVDFALGALGNAAKSTDHSLAHKLLRLTRPLQDSNTIVHKSIAALESRHWSLHWSGPAPAQTDELDQLVACSRALTEDVRQVTSFIQGNAPLLFKRATSGPSSAILKDVNKKNTTPTLAFPEKDQAAHHEWIEDYDYVNLESKAKFDQENEEIKESLPLDMKQSFDVLVTESQALLPPEKATLTANDRNVVDFYASQAETYIQYLTNAIDSFIVTIENNQPPKVFIAYSKFIILNAYKLVSVGDAVHRNVTQEPLKRKVLEKSNALCDGLKASVQATKKAGREFPSVVAVQEMLDSVVHVSQLAQQLKLSIRPI